MVVPALGDVVVLDIPGSYSLAARTQEERIAIETLAGLNQKGEPDAVVVVVDGTQLGRSLYLALEIIELRLPVVIALNMADVLKQHHMIIDTKVLSEALGVPVVPISAALEKGLDDLKEVVGEVLAKGGPIPRQEPLEGVLGQDLDAVQSVIPQGWGRGDEERRRALAGWALLSLGDDDELWDLPDSLRQHVQERRKGALEQDRDLDLELISRHWDWIDARMPSFIKEVPSTLRRMSDAIDRVLIHPVFGFMLFLMVMALLFQSLFSWSDPLITGVESVVGGFALGLGAILPEGVFGDFVTEGLVGGVGAILVFLPQILLLFLFISILEDSGYMARAAILMDRIMKALGLTGRAFVPMISGFACAIPAIMATRTMERQRDRMLTMMVVPLMTCSARLPVYTLIIAALFPGPDAPGGMVGGIVSLQAALMVGMYLFSTVVALLAAAVLGRTLFQGAAPPLLLELPPYRLPRPRSVLRMMWERGRLFVTEAGSVILTCTVVLWVLLPFPQDPPLSRDYEAEMVSIQSSEEAQATPTWKSARLETLLAEQSAERLQLSYGSRLGHMIEPAIAPLGFDWKIGVGLVGAFAAREVFVSTMGVVYGVGDDVGEESLPLREKIKKEKRPDGTPVYTPLVGLSLMVFFALAAQCMSTLAVVRRETRSTGWAVFLFVYMTALAWCASFAVYQGGQWLGYS